MKKRTLTVVLNILSLVAALVINYLAVNLPLNNLTPKEISDSFDIYFVPAAYAFSIWSLIYVGLLAFAIYQALPAQRENMTLAKIDSWFLLSNIANSLWLVCFHYQRFALALLVMAILLYSLIKIHLILDIGIRVTNSAWRWLVEIPFNIYFGWITVASISNASQVLDYYNWNGFGIAPEIWFVIMVTLVVIISALMSFQRRVFTYTLVIIWALVGIAVKFPGVPMVSYTAWSGAIMVAVLSMLALTMGQRRRKV